MGGSQKQSWKLRWSWLLGLLTISLYSLEASAIDLDLNDDESIKKAASTIAYDMVKYYTGNRTGDVPGNLPDPYYWWEAGAMFGALIDYWYYTGDASYNDITMQALLHQAGPNGDFMPLNQTRTEGNDDQSFWAFSAMAAAELNFPNPPEDKPQWLAMVQAVFNEQAARWNTEACGGGLKWQIFTFNNGYDYRNTIANGCFFNIASRLARYTGNQTYADWAIKSWNWVRRIGLISDSYQAFDGTDDTNNCTTINHVMWTYNNGVFLHGAANMYNYTNGSAEWKEHINGLLNSANIFFSTNESSKDVMYEVACELINDCQTDQFSFKAYLSRWMTATTQLAPFTHDIIMTRLGASARAAAAQCTGGDTGTQCGMKWTLGHWDGTTGVGQQMSALEVVQGNLVKRVKGPVTSAHGGTSKGNAAAGTETGDTPIHWDPITTGDRVGAAFVTTALLVSIIGCTYIMVS